MQVPFKSSVAELYELIWQEGVELAVSVIPQAEMGDSFYLPLTRSKLLIVDKLSCFVDVTGSNLFQSFWPLQ